MSSSSIHGIAVLDRLREIQRQKQALDVEELGLIVQLESECLAHDLGAKSTAVLLRDALHISARGAAGRLRLAQAVMPRQMLSGAVVQPAHPQTAQALADGTISIQHAATVIATADKISDLVVDDAGPLFETQLIQFAAEHDPETLARFAHGLYARVDQDGAFREFELAHRRRDLAVRRRPDRVASPTRAPLASVATTRCWKR